MKKIFMALMLSLISIASFGQVTIQKNQKTSEIVVISNYADIYHDLRTDEYCLRVRSDNQFEDKLRVIELGTGSEEAMKSLTAIEEAWESCKDGESFDVSGVTCYVNKGFGMFLRLSNPPYTAGNYYMFCEFTKRLGIYDKALKKYKKGKF